MSYFVNKVAIIIYIRYNDTDEINRFIAQKNPFRYRSYYYDIETGLYYLNSRYYDPELGRFINADDVSMLDITKITLNGLNLFTYCLNNPVNEVDENGTFILWLLISAIVIGAIAGGAINGVKAYNEGARGWGLFGSILGGAVMGAAMGAAMGIGGLAGMASIGMVTFGLTTGAAIGLSIGIGVAAGLVSYSLENGLREDKTWKWQEFLLEGFSGGVKALTTFGIAYYGGKFGAFDKFSIKALMGKEFIKNIYAYDMAKSVLAAAIPSFGRTLLTNLSYYLGESLTKLIFINGLASGLRWILNKIFKT